MVYDARMIRHIRVSKFRLQHRMQIRAQIRGRPQRRAAVTEWGNPRQTVMAVLVTAIHACFREEVRCSRDAHTHRTTYALPSDRRASPT